MDGKIAKTGCSELAQELEMDIQFNVLKGYGEDGAAIQKTHKGTPTINIAVPTRYLHSHNGVISRSDFNDTVKLISNYRGKIQTQMDAIIVFGGSLVGSLNESSRPTV